MRRDGTLRAGARPDLCIGVEGGTLEEGKRLVFWRCGEPPFQHELFFPVQRSKHGSLLRSMAKPALCIVVPGGTRALLEIESASIRVGVVNVGPTVLLGS